MRVLGSSVLAMEFFVICFAMLLANKNSGVAISIGWSIALLTLLTAGLLKKKIGWLLGSLLQIALIFYGYFVTPMYFMGALFAILWISAILVGRRGEGIRAQLLRESGKNL
jgi:Protein of unknown function (DUF4233)